MGAAFEEGLLAGDFGAVLEGGDGAFGFFTFEVVFAALISFCFCKDETGLWVELTSRKDGEAGVCRRRVCPASQRCLEPICACGRRRVCSLEQCYGGRRWRRSAQRT